MNTSGSSEKPRLLKAKEPILSEGHGAREAGRRPRRTLPFPFRGPQELMRECDSCVLHTLGLLSEMGMRVFSHGEYTG